MHVRYKLRVLGNGLLKRFNLPHIPPRIPLYFVEVTNKCNLSCDFCPRNDLSRGIGFMEFDLFKLVVGKIRETGCRFVNLNRFGESLTHPRFVEMLRYAKGQGLRNIGVISNGQLLTPETIEKIVDAGIDRINVSLDTLDKEKYESARRGAKLETTLANIDALIRYRERVGSTKPVIAIFSVLVTEEFGEMQKLFREYADRVNYIEFRPIATYGSTQRLKDLPHIRTPKVNMLTCVQPWQRLNIFYNGDVNPCCGDVDGELVFGNIKNSSINELWYGAGIKRIRKILASKKLRDLPICSTCDGTSKDWNDKALLQLRETYGRLDPDIDVREVMASTPVLFRHSTGKVWK